MAKTRYKPEELMQQGEPAVAILPSEQPVSPFLDPSVAQAEPQGSELYNLGTVQQRAVSTRDADMYMPSYLQAARNYPTGAEGGATRPEGASPMLYPSQAETQPRVRARYKPEEALAIAEANRPKRYSPDQMLDIAAESMFDASQPPLPKDLWKAATQRRSEMVKDGRLPMEFGQIDSLKDGIVWAANSLYGAGSYLVSAPIAAATSYAASPIESQRQMHATAAATIKRLSTEFGLQTYQDIFNLTHEPKYRVKETGQFVAVNKTGLPLMLPAASGGNNVISGDGIINPVAPEAGMRQFAKEGMTLVPTNEQDLEDYRYGQYLDRMGVGAQSIEDMKAKAPPELLAALASGNWDSVEPNQAQTELALLAAQAAIPIGGSARTWGVGRRVAAGISKAAEKVEAIAGFPVDVDTALRAKFVKAVTSGTGADAVAQKTAMQAAIDAGKTTAKVGGAYGVAAGVSSFEGTPSEIKDLAWTAANLYSGYKGGMYVARQLRSASGFTKTVLKEVADPSRGLDAGARAAVAANPAVPQSVREVLESPSRYRAMESTPARLSKNPELSPTSRAVFNKLSDYRFVQTARLARDTAAGVPKGIALNAPFIAGALASDDPERAGQMIAAGGLFGAVGGAASRFTEANMRRGEEANSDIARMLVDVQAGNELGSGLGGEIMRNRVRPGTKFQDGERGFVMPEQEVASFLTEMEMAGADVAAFVQGKSFDELAQWAAYQGFFRNKVDLVPLNATDYKLNAEAAGQNGSGAYFLQPSEGRRARIFVNAESRRNGLAPHEYGHAVLRGGALSPDQIDAVHAEINARYAPDALRNMAGEYAATMVRAENAKQGINIEPSPAAITAKVNELSQGSMIKGSADGLDWLREEIFAEEFRNANIDMNRARRNIPLGANPVSFFENLLGAQSRALHMAGIDIDPQTGKPMGRDQIFKENRVAAGDPVVMKNYEDYVKQWKRWINDPTHEVDPGVPLSKTGNPQDTANSPNVTWKDYGRGRMETEFAVKNPDGSVTPKDWNKEIKPTVRARQQAVREMSNRSKEVAAADDQTFGMRRRRDGRLETSGRRLPDSFFFIPQYKPFHDILRKINAADDIGETLQVRFFAKGKSKDVFKDGIKNTSAVNREALHGNFVAKKDGTLMWGWLDMTQFRNRAMKAIADRNPALSEYDWNLKAIMDDLPVHLTDQRRGKGGAFSVGPERANILNGLIGIGDGPLVGAFGKGTAYKTIHLDSIDAIVPTGKTGGEFDVYRANRNAMPDDPKPPVDMETDIDNNRMPQQIPREAQGMPDVAASGRGNGMPKEPRRVGPLFHGTQSGSFERFDASMADPRHGAFFFGEKSTATQYGPNVRSYYLDFDNLFDPTKNKKHLELYRKWSKQQEKTEPVSRDGFVYGPDFFTKEVGSKDFRVNYQDEWWISQKIKDAGFDGFVTMQPDNSTAYAVFDPNKIAPAQRAQAMPDSLESIPTDQLQRQYEENQGYLGLSTLGMREGRPVRGGAAQTRELLRRNEAISAELERRGVREEDPQLQRALQRRGQAMPDAVHGDNTPLPPQVPDRGFYIIGTKPTADGRVLEYHLDPATTIQPRVADIESIRGEQVAMLEADRHNTRGDNMGGPLHPFLISNQTIARLLDGRGFKAVWANMNSAFVTRAKNIVKNTTAGHALIQIMKENAHRSNRKFVMDVTSEIDARRANMTSEQADFLHVLLELGAINPQGRINQAYSRIKRASDAALEGEATMAEVAEAQRDYDQTFDKYQPMVEFLNRLSPLKSHATRGRSKEFAGEFASVISKHGSSPWYSSMASKYRNTKFVDEAARFSFKQRGAAMDRITGIPFAPDVKAMLKNSMDFVNGQNLDVVGVVQLSKDMDAFAVYFGKNPKEEAKMSANERMLRDQFLASGTFKAHPSYDWVMLGPENADSFILDAPADPLKLFPDYAKNHPNPKVKKGSKETVVGTMKKSKIPLVLK